MRQITREDLRGQVGEVLQDRLLFRASIGENIAYGRPESAPEAVIAASKAGNWVGERGAGLAGGEQQRVGGSRGCFLRTRGS